MKQTKLVLLALIPSILVTTVESLARFDANRYQIIIDRKPFGDPPRPPPPAPKRVAPIPPHQSFAKTLRMSSIIRVEGGGNKVGLIDLKTNLSFFLIEGEGPENGGPGSDIELVEANYEEEEAVLRKGAEMAIIKLADPSIKTISPADHQKRTQKSRRNRTPRRQPPPRQPKTQLHPPDKREYTYGEDVWEHLQNYQEEVIRQGLPPLPIQLTPDQDDRLVVDGILLPLEQ